MVQTFQNVAANRIVEVTEGARCARGEELRPDNKDGEEAPADRAALLIAQWRCLAGGAAVAGDTLVSKT